MRIGQSNVNSLARKLSVVSEFVHHHKLHLFAVTESHLLCSMPDSFIDIPSYCVVRSDVRGNFSKHGVCMYIHRRVKYDHVTMPCPNVLTVHLPEFQIYVVVVYRPPSSTPDDNQRLYEFLIAFCLDKEVLVLGDFNLPSIAWESTDPCFSASSADRQGYEVFMSLGLTQWVKEPTFPRSGNILDLVLSTDGDRVAAVEVSPPLPGCDHCPVLCNYVFDFNFSFQTDLDQCRMWHKGKYNLFLQALNDIDWDFELSNRHLDSAYCRFIDILKALTDDYVPLSAPPRASLKLPWKTNPPRSLRNRRKEAWDRVKSVRHRLGRNSLAAKLALKDFFSANSALKSFAAMSQSAYEQDLIVDLKTAQNGFTRT